MEILEIEVKSVKIINNQWQMRVLIHVKTAFESHNLIKYNLLQFLEVDIPFARIIKVTTQPLDMDP